MIASASPPNEGGSVRRFVGYALMAIGLLIAISAGLCTGLVVFSGVSELGSKAFESGLLIVPSTIGGVPFLIGTGLFLVGRAIARAARRPPVTPPADLRPPAA